jgi:hypothetical protein
VLEVPLSARAAAEEHRELLEFMIKAIVVCCVLMVLVCFALFKVRTHHRLDAAAGAGAGAAGSADAAIMHACCCGTRAPLRLPGSADLLV